MNRAELKKLSRGKVRDASVLLAGKRWSCAYYIIGYAAECGLKSCVLAHLQRTGMIFKDRKYLKNLGDCWTHDLDNLMDLADLKQTFGQAQGANPALAGYWGVAKLWKETSRYEQRTKTEAEELFEAITHDPDGLLRWIQNHW